MGNPKKKGNLRDFMEEEKQKDDIKQEVGLDEEKVVQKQSKKKDSLEIEYFGREIKTPEELLKHCEIDMEVWEEDRVTINHWPVGGKAHQGQNDQGHWRRQKLWKMQLIQIKITLKRKSDERRALQDLLDDIKKERKIHVPVKKAPKSRKKKKLALEIAIMDPHMGLECYTPEADQPWTTDLCEQFYLFSVHDLIQQALQVGEFSKIFWVLGNDFCHTDNVWNTTTSGTPQPEGVSAHRAFHRAKALAISAAEKMLEYAPVSAFQIPGNHDRFTSYMLGHVLDAYFHAHPDFTIDASASPFKKFRFGASLVGMEHGHSISTIRLAALMANEWRWDWAETHYHEWHMGDQHRKGSSKPCAFEEQGVSVEFLPSIVAPNEWHRLKSFNMQKRAAVGFVWDYDCGQSHRLTTNISKYTGQWMGDRYDKWLADKKLSRKAS